MVILIFPQKIPTDIINRKNKYFLQHKLDDLDNQRNGKKIYYEFLTKVINYNNIKKIYNKVFFGINNL